MSLNPECSAPTMEARPWKKSAKGVESTPSSSSSSCFIENLPNPVLMEILCRVSIKTLTTSKSVCKSWLHLIKDPHFCQLHQRKSPSEVCFQPYHDDESNTLELHLGNFNFPNNLDPCHFQIPKFSVTPQNVPNYKVVKQTFIFSNYCNGLLCYYGDSHDHRFAVVWNPCTSEFITFPPPPSPCRGYGLGFSRKENKFKLLRLMGGSKASDTVVADICTIEKACSWKRIGPCPSHAWFRDYSYELPDLQAVFLEDALHWVDTRPTGGDGSGIAIHTFDFEDDHFGALPLPPCFDASMLREDMLGVSEGRLFVTDYRKYTNGGSTIWLMMDYGVQGSWTKLFLPIATFDKALKYIRCRPITCMDNDEILSTYTFSSTTVCVYNPVLESGRVIGSGPVSLRVIVYNPSLVLLKDSMLGYDVHVKPKCAGSKQGEISTTPYWWTPMKNRWIPMKKSSQEHGSKAPLTNDEFPGTEVEEERERHISGKGLLQISTTSAADLAVTVDEIHVSSKREDGLERITTMMGEVLEELRKEREQRQELEERLRNELEPLKEQTEHLKLQNQQFEERLKQHTQHFEERLQDEHEKVEHLQQQNLQFEERLQDEHVNVEHLKQQNQQFEDRLQDEHAKVKHLQQQNLQFEERLQDEHVNVEHLKQQNQQFEDRLQDEHAKVKHLEDKIEKLSN